MSSNYLYGWGANSHGQLGIGTCCDITTHPTKVQILDEIKQNEMKFMAGSAGHSFILLNDGSVYASGWNHIGQLGVTGCLGTKSFIRADILEKYKIDYLTSLWETSYGIESNGCLLGWGANNFGQLGRNSSDLISSKIPLVLMDCVKGVAAGLRHTVILSKNGQVLTCGFNKKGILGRSITDNDFCEVKPVNNLNEVREIACGQSHNVAITIKNELYVWGDNKFGQCGLDPKMYPIIPLPHKLSGTLHLPQSLVKESTKVFCGWTHTVLVTDGILINWGRNNYYQLGEKRNNSWMPKTVGFYPNCNDNLRFKQVTVGSEHNLALSEDNVLYAWGWNEHGNCGVSPNCSSNNLDSKMSLPFFELKQILNCNYIKAVGAHSFAFAEINSDNDDCTLPTYDEIDKAESYSTIESKKIQQGNVSEELLNSVQAIFNVANSLSDDAVLQTRDITTKKEFVENTLNKKETNKLYNIDKFVKQSELLRKQLEKNLIKNFCSVNDKTTLKNEKEYKVRLLQTTKKLSDIDKRIEKAKLHLKVLGANSFGEIPPDIQLTTEWLDKTIQMMSNIYEQLLLVFEENLIRGNEIFVETNSVHFQKPPYQVKLLKF